MSSTVSRDVLKVCHGVCWHFTRPVGTSSREVKLGARALSAMLKYVQQTPGDKRKREEDPNVRPRPSRL